MKIRTFAITTLIMLFAASTASANEIYKWTDADGNVHFGDRPQGDAPIRVAIVSRPTDRAAVQAQVSARADARTSAAKDKAAAAAEEPSEDEVQAAAAERTQNCANYRERLQKMLQSRRLYREDEAGERVYLDEAEMRTARQDVENKISEYCGS